MKKKLIALLCLVGLLSIAVGCGTTTDSESTPDSSSQSVAESSSVNTSDETASSETASSETASSETASSETASSETASSESTSSESTSSESTSSESTSSDSTSSDSSSSESSSSDSSSSGDSSETPPAVEDNTYAIGTEIYENTTMTKKDGVITYTASKYGAQTFKDVELAQGTDFVVYATVEAGMTAENVGFVLGTFEEESSFLMFQWRRKVNDFYVYREEKGSGVSHKDGIFASNIGTEGAQIALVYKNGRYYAFLNGTKVCEFGSTFDNGWGGAVNVANQIGTTGKLKLGLSIAFGTAQFSECGYSTDAEAINAYVPDPEEPSEYAIGTEIYEGSMTKLGDVITYSAVGKLGAQVFDDVELAQGTNYVLYAKVDAGMTAENVGFVVGTLGTDNTNHLLFQWRKNVGDFYVWKDKGGWVGHADNIYKSSIGTEGAEIALVYKDGTYYAFLNGVKVCSFGSKFDNGWGKNVEVANTIGTEGALKVGLSVGYGTAQFSEYGYSTDADVINGYVPDPEEPIDYAIGEEIYEGSMTKLGDVITYSAVGKLGAQVFDDVELAQGTNYVLYAKVDAGMTAENVGFVVGTLGTDNTNHLLFQWRRKNNVNDFYVWRSKGGWVGHEDNIYKSSIGTEGAEIALVYKNGKYYAFLNGNQVCNFGATLDNGWGGTVNVAGTIGTEGALKVGLSVGYGTAQFSEYGYSTDADVINAYVPNTETPPVEKDEIVSKPGIGNNIYTANNREIGVNGDGNLVFNSEKGAVFFEGAEVQQGQSYVVYATMSSIGGTPDGIGFAVGTLADGDAKHAMFVWRENDIYVVRMANEGAWGWSGETSVSCSKTRDAAELALVYKDGIYYMFIDGDKVFEWSETAVYDGWGAKIQNMVGTEGTIKLGLANLSSDATFTDWGYSTDADVIAEWLN